MLQQFFFFFPQFVPQYHQYITLYLKMEFKFKYNFFEGLYNQFKMKKSMQKYSKLQWSPKEQEYLKQLREAQNLASWKCIAALINNQFPDKNRNGKQCRQRYMNYVRFTKQKPKVSGWAQIDDLLLFDYFLQYGAKWVQISNSMAGRSENCLKNRFYGALRKVIRKINNIEKQKKLKYKKSIKYDSLIRILGSRIEENCQQLSENSINKFIKQLRKDLIELAISQQDSFPKNQVLSLIVRVHQFNCLGRNSNQTKKEQLLSSNNNSAINLNHRLENYDIQLDNSTHEASPTMQILLQNEAFPSQKQLESKEQNSLMLIINQNNYINHEKFNDLDQLICNILKQSYAPQKDFYF